MTHQWRGFAAPEQRRTNEMIRRPFDVHFADSKDEIANAELRRVWAAEAIPDAYSELTQDVWTVLVQNDEHASAINGNIIIRQDKEDGGILMRGLDFHTEVNELILPEMRSSLIALSQSELDTDSALNRMATLVGTVVAETQAFVQGNTRVARTMHDFILYGTEGLKSVNIHNSPRSFMPDVATEQSILEQNVTRLLNAVDGATPSKVYELLGGTYVSHETLSTLTTAKGQVNAISNAAKAFAKSPSASDYLKEDERFHAARGMNEVLSQTLEDSEVRYQVIATLLQKEYGAAAWAVVFQGGPVPWPLGEADAKALIDANRSLLVMRIMSLMGGIVAGGTFVSMEDSETPGRARDIVLRKWLPTANLLMASTRGRT